MNKTEETKKIWNPTFLLALGMFFTFLPSCIFYGINYGRLGRTKSKKYTFLATILYTLLLLAFDGKLAKTFGIAINMPILMFIYSKQKPLFEEYKENGGESNSILIPLGVCIALTILYFFGSTISA